jgi:hypothetical protein
MASPSQPIRALLPPPQAKAASMLGPLSQRAVGSLKLLTSSGSPSIDINIPGFTAVKKLHF